MKKTIEILNNYVNSYNIKKIHLYDKNIYNIHMYGIDIDSYDIADLLSYSLIKYGFKVQYKNEDCITLLLQGENNIYISIEFNFDNVSDLKIYTYLLLGIIQGIQKKEDEV